MINVQFKASEKLARMLNTRLSGFDIEVGILQDGPVAKWKRERAGDLAGGPRNKQAGTSNQMTLRKQLGKFNVMYNLLLAPWRSKDNKDILVLIREMARSGLKAGGGRRRFLNAAQAVVRNPIARAEYGDNTAGWAKAKGFNRLLINTGRLFNSIKARFIK